MSAQSPGAYGLSALLHLAVAGMILFVGYASTSIVKDNPKVLELVAGEGDNYAATEAPALGSSAGIKLEAPAAAPQPVAMPNPAPIQQAPIQPAPPEALPAPPKAAKAHPTSAPKPVDLVKSLKRAEARREKRLELQHEKERRAELAREIANAKADQQRRVKHVDAAGIAAGVLGGSTANKEGGANGKALSRQEASLMEAYVAELKTEIKQSHVPPDGVSSSLSADVEFLLAADGTMSHIRIVRSSGDRGFDRSVIEAFEHTRSIGPRPDGITRTETMTFKMQEEDTQ